MDITVKMKRKATSDATSRVVNKRSKESTAAAADDDDDDDDDLMDLSQNPGFNIEREAELGIIEKICLRNFMCHERLTIQFGPNINFLIGSNGSGKSAVITALIVGLGGKASVTSRGNKLKTFIKTGKQTGSVEVKLRNRGVDAFKHELYGNSIIVERKFNSDGSSQYKLKNGEGKLVSQKKDDLSRMLDQFNIQVDNPVAVLNQEASKNFLNSKSPHDKYKFFLKATQLEQIKEDYSRANEQKEITNAIIEQKEKTLPKLGKEVQDWERKFKSLTAIEDLKNKVKRLKGEMAWAFVIEREKAAQQIEKQAKVEEARLPKFKQSAAEAKAKLDAMHKAQSDMTTKLNSASEEIKELQPALNKAKMSLKEQKQKQRKSHMELRTLESTLKNLIRDRDSIKLRIEELINSVQQDFESERRDRQEKIAALTEQLQSVQAQEATTDHHLDQVRSAITKYKNDKYKLGQDSQLHQGQVDKLQRNVQILQAAQGSRLRRFGPFMDKLSQQIDQYTSSGRFHKKPIGPLGAHFTVRDQKWALAVECCLKNLMHSFCCHDYHDEKVLSQLIKSVAPAYKASYIVSSFKDNVYDVSRMRAKSDQYQTVLDVIQSDLPMVYNTLIDQRTVECVLLIEDGKEARRVMDPDGNPGPPPNSREAFTLRGDQVYCKPTFRYYSSNQDKARYLTSNAQEDIASMTVEINKLTQQQATLRQQLAELDREITQNKTEERRTETKLMKLRDSKHKLNMEIREQKDVEDPAPVDVTTYREEVAVLEKQVEDHQARLEASRTKNNEETSTLKDIEASTKQTEAEMRAKLDTAESIKEDYGRCIDEMETAKGNKNHYDNKLKEQEKKVKALKDSLAKELKKVETDVEKAEQIHQERINTNRSLNSIETQLNQIHRTIQNEEKQKGDPVEITRQYKEKKDAYLKIRKEVQQLKRFCENLDQVVSRRLKQYILFRRMIGTRAKYFFISLLGNRQYTGHMEFNHEKETLEINVQPVKTSGHEGAKDLKSLSGGERSFSTVCFILSLWDAMESPFRCLDEFDVYMDMVNRRISMQMLIETAKSQPGRQFIFLTPQSMSNLDVSSSNVKILEMPKPIQGQQTLNFGNNEEDED